MPPSVYINFYNLITMKSVSKNKVSNPFVFKTVDALILKILDSSNNQLDYKFPWYARIKIINVGTIRKKKRIEALIDYHMNICSPNNTLMCQFGILILFESGLVV